MTENSDLYFDENSGPASAGFRALELDADKYLALLDDPALSEAQKVELLRAVWGIMAKCVELHFRVPTIPDIFNALLAGSSGNPSDSVESSKALIAAPLPQARSGKEANDG